MSSPLLYGLVVYEWEGLVGVVLFSSTMYNVSGMWDIRTIRNLTISISCKAWSSRSDWNRIQILEI